MTISQAVTLDISTGAATVGNMIFMQRERDGRQLDFTVLNNGSAYTLTGFTDKIIVIEKPDGEIIYNDLTNVTKNTAKYTFTSQSQIVKGLLRCWLKFTLGGQIVVTPEFHIRVNEVADFDTAAESTSEFGVLDRLIGDVEAAVIECNAATDAMTEMTEDFENATATATTLAEGEAATVSLTDGALGKEFAFGIPKGDKGEKGDTGDAATITVGTVATVDPTAPATVVNSGTLAAAIFDFGIPKGVKGDMGEVSTAEMNAAITAATSITLTNLASNSDFSDGTMGWMADLSTLSASDNTLFVTGNGTQRLSNLYGNIPATIPSGHRFCQRAYIKVDSALCTEIRIYGGDSSRVVETNPTIDIWHPITYIGTTGGDLDYAYFYHYYETPEICAGKVMSVRYVSMFDLTDLETALGREVTVGEMSAIMDIYDGWFSGSVNLSWLQLIMTIINLFHP